MSAPVTNPTPPPAQVTFTGTLFADAAWKEEALSRLEIIFDDRRNESTIPSFDLVENYLQYGKTYEITISVQEIAPTRP